MTRPDELRAKAKELYDQAGEIEDADERLGVLLRKTASKASGPRIQACHAAANPVRIPALASISSASTTFTIRSRECGCVASRGRQCTQRGRSDWLRLPCAIRRSIIAGTFSGS